MCGIVGLWHAASGAPVDPAQLAAMREDLRHRGPDDAGMLVEGAVGLGHRRLSIIDLSAGRQPLGNEDGTVAIVFNGEIYNYRELQVDLRARGHRLATMTDSEVIVHLYEDLGAAAVDRLRGMFAFAIWDRARDRMLLARDRAGVKPLYWAWRDGRLAFASEIRPLLRLPWVSREIDPRSLDAYLERGYVPAPYTMFRDVQKLPAAHRLIVDRQGPRVERYWVAKATDGGAGRDAAELRDRLVTALDDSVRAHLVSDVPLGAFLSGGLDSSVVVALMRRHCTGTLKTFSVAVDAGHEYDESAHARLVARHLGTEHHELRLSEDEFPALLENAATFLDEPVSDPAAVPTFMLARLARESVTVVLTGEGADETWGGYDVFRRGLRVARYRRLPSWLRRTVVDGLVSRLPAAGAGARLVAASNDPAYLARLSHLDVEMRRRLYTGGARTALGATAAAAAEDMALDAGDPYGAILRDLIDSHLGERLLVKVDRMTMAHSLEARVPYLDHVLIEFSMAVPTRLKLRGRTTKYLLRRAFADLLPPEIVRRRKQPFNVPCSRWLRSTLAPLARDAFDAPLLAPYLDVTQLRALWRRHLTGEADHGTALWALLSLELWARAVRGGAA